MMGIERMKSFHLFSVILSCFQIKSSLCNLGSLFPFSLFPLYHSTILPGFLYKNGWKQALRLDDI